MHSLFVRRVLGQHSSMTLSSPVLILAIDLLPFFRPYVCVSVQFMREGVFCCCCCCSCFPSVCWEQKAPFTLALAAAIPLHPTTNDLLLLIIFVAISAPVLIIIIFRFVCFATMNEGVCVFELVVGRCDCGRSHEIRENKFLKIN